MKIALAQIDATVADLAGNSRRILAAASRAKKAGAELVVFPEQSLGGYPALDLWEDRDFLRAQDAAMRDLSRSMPSIPAIVGVLAPNRNRRGKPVHNSAALIEGGRVRAMRHKTLLPTYDVFDERRYFAPAQDNAPMRLKGLRVGISICEDAWSAHAPSGLKLYARDPIEEQIRSGVDLLINLSASPFVRGKIETRAKILSRYARRARAPFMYVNLVGGNDELVFDGRSLAIDARGRLCAVAKAFAEDLLIVDTERLAPLAPVRSPGIEEVAGALQLGLADYVHKCGFRHVFVGLSGGIDSAVVCALAARALGPRNVTGVFMPSPYTSRESADDARRLAAACGVRFLAIPIGPLYAAYREALRPVFGKASAEGVAEQNIQARIRGNLLMALANKEGGIVLATGNKSEFSVGYSTLYGDMAGGLSVLADVPKETVYELSRFINKERAVIPRHSIDRAPSAELRIGQKDSDDLPPYPVLDKILKSYIEQGSGYQELLKESRDPKLVNQILDRIDKNEYKRRQAAPSLKISPKSFGVGRRLPIARGVWRRYLNR
jgi:NAD+ synthetase